MLRIKEIKDALGAPNVELLLDEIDEGIVEKDCIQTIALKMKGGVHGVFVEKTLDRQCSLKQVMRHMLDKWYTHEIYKCKQDKEDPLDKLKNILEDKDVKLDYLAQQMTPVKLTKATIAAEQKTTKPWVLSLENKFNPDDYILNKNDDETSLGRGDYGDVYKATLKENNYELPEEIAVKTISWTLPEAKGYEENEWNLHENEFNFQNENLIKMFYLSFTVPKQNMRNLKIYMEICDESLHDFIYRKALNSEDIKHVTVGVLRGLHHLHSQQIIHRDLKPQNILLKNSTVGDTSIQNKIIKLSDFSFSKWSPQKRNTSTNTPRLGNPSFWAPEVMLLRNDGKTRYGESIDIWALGIVVYLLSEKEGLVDEDELRSDNLDSHIKAKLRTIPDEDLRNFLTTCLHKNPKSRGTTETLLNHDFIDNRVRKNDVIEDTNCVRVQEDHAILVAKQMKMIFLILILAITVATTWSWGLHLIYENA